MEIKIPSREPHLNSEQAEQILRNVFDICDMVPNSIPLETLESYSNYRAERFTFKRALIGLIIVAFLLVPFLFMAPDMTVNDLSKNANTPKYEITVNSLFPITSVTASINGNNVPAFETGTGIYTIEPNQSGEMIVVATCANRQIREVSIDVAVDKQDETAPVLIRNIVKSGQVYLYVSDDDSGIDYSSAFGQYDNGDKVNPVTFNSNEGYLVFDYPTSNITYYVSDKDGNVLKLTVNID